MPLKITGVVEWDGAEKGVLRGCLSHNHPDNPTMKRVTWRTKRQIAKCILLGHPRDVVQFSLFELFSLFILFVPKK